MEIRKNVFQTNRQNHRNGAVLPLVMLMLPVLVIVAAFLLNLSYLELAQTELQIAADASARAGGRTLANTGDKQKAIDKTLEIAALNTVAGKPFLLDASNIEFGTATRPDVGSRFEFATSAGQINSIKVDARRDDSALDGPIQMLLPGFLGVENASIGAVSVSAQVDLDIAIVIDRSGSMAYASDEDSNTFDNPAAAPPGWSFGDEVPTPSRWLDAENALSAFLNILAASPQSEFVSLVTYGDTAELDLPLTDDYLLVMAGMRARGAAFQEARTNIGEGVMSGIESLNNDINQREIATKIILVLTDGIHNQGTSPETAARRARNEDAFVFTITFSNEAEQNRMKLVAEIGNGKHFQANSAAELVAAFEEIARSLPTLIVE